MELVLPNSCCTSWKLHFHLNIKFIKYTENTPFRNMFILLSIMSSLQYLYGHTEGATLFSTCIYARCCCFYVSLFHCLLTGDTSLQNMSVQTGLHSCMTHMSMFYICMYTMESKLDSDPYIYIYIYIYIIKNI